MRAGVAGSATGLPSATGVESTGHDDSAEPETPTPLEHRPTLASLAQQRLYIPALDGVRFLAFFLVLFNHFPPRHVFDAWSYKLSTLVETLCAFGGSGVDVFLTLSGFLIGTLLLRELDATHHLSISRFYWRRVLRIWPLYYLLLMIGFFVAPIVAGQASTAAHWRLISEHLFPFVTLFGNFSSATMLDSMNAMSPAADSLGPLWTIAMEEQFYLVFPLIMAATAPSVRLQTVLPCVIALIAFSAATRFYILANNIPYPMVWMNTLAHLDPIVLGILGSVVWRHHGAAFLRLRLFGADVVLAVGAFWLTASFPVIGRSMHTVWQMLAVSVAALLLIGSVLRYRPLGLLFGCGPVAWLGRISYGLYMYHLLARQAYQYGIAPVIPIGDLLRGPVRWLVEMVLVLGFTTALAAISYYGFERHFLRLKERFAIIPSRPA
jgi:peptidoglycan/LPS O-acetylase OafA/YrhL